MQSTIQSLACEVRFTVRFLVVGIQYQYQSDQCLLIRVVQSRLDAPVLLLQLLSVSLQPAKLLLLPLHHSVQLLDVLPVLFLHLLLPIKNLNTENT